MRHFKAEIIFFLFIAAILIIAFFGVKHSINIVEAPYKDQLGKVIVIDRDTATIVDYSVLFKTFTLSNGVTVSSYFIIKNNHK